jgi:predicted transcriptional regulator
LRGRHLERTEPPPITQALALADELRDLLETESVNQSQLARRFGLSRARVNQLLRLCRLHPLIQEYVRNLRGVGPRYITERRLRPISYLDTDKQLKELARLRPELADSLSAVG